MGPRSFKPLEPTRGSLKEVELLRMQLYLEMTLAKSFKVEMIHLASSDIVM